VGRVCGKLNPPQWVALTGQQPSEPTTQPAVGVHLRGGH